MKSCIFKRIYAFFLARKIDKKIKKDLFIASEMSWDNTSAIKNVEYLENKIFEIMAVPKSKIETEVIVMNQHQEYNKMLTDLLIEELKEDIQKQYNNGR